MKNVKWIHHLFTFLAVLPVLLVLCLWLRSYLPGDLNIRSQSGRLYLFFTEGYATWEVAPKPNPQSVAEPPTPRGSWNYLEQAPLQAEVTRVYLPGAWYIAHDGASYARYAAVAVAYPYLLLPAAVPLWWLYKHRRRRRRLAGRLCTQCGYDLRESHDRCPECGAAAPPAAPGPAPTPTTAAA